MKHSDLYPSGDEPPRFSYRTLIVTALLAIVAGGALVGLLL